MVRLDASSESADKSFDEENAGLVSSGQNNDNKKLSFIRLLRSRFSSLSGQEKLITFVIATLVVGFVFDEMTAGKFQSLTVVWIPLPVRQKDHHGHFLLEIFQTGFLFFGNVAKVRRTE